MISRLRSNRLDFKSTRNRRHLQYSSMHYNYNTNSTSSDDDDDNRDERHYSTQLYPIQEMTERMEKILDGVVDDYHVQSPRPHRNMISSIVVDDGNVDDYVLPPRPRRNMSNSISGGGGDVHYRHEHDLDDDDSYSYDDLQYSDSDNDDNDDIPSNSQELVISVLEDMDCHHYKFQEARTKPKKDVNSENIRNGAPIVARDPTRTNTSIAERSPHYHKSPIIHKKYGGTHQNDGHHQNKTIMASTLRTTTKTITCKNKTNSSPSLHHHHHHHQQQQQQQLFQQISTSSSISVVASGSTPDEEAAGKRRRRSRNHALSQTDFCELFRLLEANQ